MIFIFLILSLIINNLLLMGIEKEYLYKKIDKVIYKSLSIYYPIISFLILYFINKEYTLNTFFILTIVFLGLFNKLIIESEKTKVNGPPYNVYNCININILDDIIILRCKDNYILKTPLSNLTKTPNFKYAALASQKLNMTINQYDLFKDEKKIDTNFKLTQDVRLTESEVITIQSFIYRSFSKKIYHYLTDGG